MQETEHFELTVSYKKGAKELWLTYKRFLKGYFLYIFFMSIVDFFIRSFDYEYAGIWIGFYIVLVFCMAVMVQIRKKIPESSVTFILNEKEVSVISKCRHRSWEIFEINYVVETKESIFIYRGYRSCIIHLPKYQLKISDVEIIKQFFREILEKKNLRFLS